MAQGIAPVLSTTLNQRSPKGIEGTPAIPLILGSSHMRAQAFAAGGSYQPAPALILGAGPNGETHE